MTVAELIAALQELPPDTKVVTVTYDGDISYSVGYQRRHVVSPSYGPADYICSARPSEPGAFEVIEIV